MSSKHQTDTQNHNIEIVVSTYWPTRLIKSITIKDTTHKSFKDELTLVGKDARFLYEQLKLIYEDKTEP